MADAECSICAGRPGRGENDPGEASCPSCKRPLGLGPRADAPPESGGTLVYTGPPGGPSFRPEIVEASRTMYHAMMKAGQAHQLEPAQRIPAASIAVARLCHATDLGSITPAILADLCCITIKDVIDKVPRDN